jgi:hypothetical protein
MVFMSDMDAIKGDLRSMKPEIASVFRAIQGAVPGKRRGATRAFFA